MSLIWADGFDHHGTDKNNLLLDAYANVPGAGITLDISGAYARTGLGALRCQGVNFTYLRKILSTPQYIYGFGCGLKHITAPDLGGARSAFRFEDASQNTILGVSVGQNMQLQLRKGDYSIIAESPNNTIKIGTYHQLEVAYGNTCGSDWVPDPGQLNYGQIEIRLDTIPVFTGTFLPVNNAGQINCISIGDTGSTGGGSCNYAVDDLVIWDTNGVDNNWFMGQRRCRTGVPNADDVSLMQWLASTGTDRFAMIDDLIPDYTDFDYSQTAGDRSQFYMQPIDVLTNSIAGVRLHAKAKKTDGGATSFRLGYNSNGTVLNSPAMGLTTDWQGYSYFFERNPSGLIPWDKTSLDAALTRLTREV